MYHVSEAPVCSGQWHKLPLLVKGLAQWSAAYLLVKKSPGRTDLDTSWSLWKREWFESIARGCTSLVYQHVQQQTWSQSGDQKVHYWPLHCPLTLTCGSFCDHVTPMHSAQKCMNILVAWPICLSSCSIQALKLLRYISMPPHTPHKHDLCFFKMFRLTCWVSLVQGKALRCRTYWFITHLPRNQKGMACHKTHHFHLWKNTLPTKTLENSNGT